MKIKSFEYPKSIRNYENKILGTLDAWSTSRLSHRPSKPAYYIVDCRILDVTWGQLEANQLEANQLEANLQYISGNLSLTLKQLKHV